ncbi:DUF192 domain-containing protein [Aquabacterium sp. A7-Y]|uniref:DUF192 domain-containing protein n=1 Tax=Aquabacterium sp. A7-Y TaxID=1349605 RepID=UPI00223E5B8D|nr:DUF192 domain-containing protein [Aquabacterium sp. A7-Y]MCW7537772.1 DUF192 domain-containing protein [Aquabacterium sp. A7-Y]
MTYIKTPIPLPTPRLRRFSRSLGALALALVAAGTAVADGRPQKLPAVPLTVGFQVVQAEVARTPEQRATGLMYRKSLAHNEGMLFVFEEPATQCFWMKNTLLPLSIAFLDEAGRVVNIADMQPQSLDSHCSAQPVRFALEVNQGWFAKRGIKAGFQIKGQPFAKP